MPHRYLLPALLALALTTATRAPAAEPLVDQVRQAIEQGKKHLLNRQGQGGDWEAEGGNQQYRGGATALALLALLNSGVPPEDPVITRGLQFLRAIPPSQTYVVGLQTMVFGVAGFNEDRERIARNVKWLAGSRIMQGGVMTGWSYGGGAGLLMGRADNSNTQYALLGLHEAQVAGIEVDPELWRSIRTFYLATQDPTGGWGYIAGAGPTFTMTTAGLCGLLIAGMDLNQGREAFAGGRWTNCGSYEENRGVVKALDWLAARFPAPEDIGRLEHTYYALYGIERAGRLSGLRFFGEHDWYRSGCEYLVRRQNGGAWPGGGHGGTPLVNTCFALLFLSRGRTPVLISKFVHDGRDLAQGRVFRANAPVNDWNNDRNDARHLADFASRELFKRQPMGWQVFNPRAADGRPPEDLAAELLQSPIAYITGHWSPEFTGLEIETLRKYVDNGGFLLAEACCNRAEFDRGFRDLMAQMFPDTPLTPLPDDHPIWTASGKFAVPPNRRFKLEGIQMGCKTVVVYSPQDLSCWWESNQYAREDGQTAFRLGANIIAYATGLEAPRPRLTAVEVAKDVPVERKLPRGYLKVAQLRHEGDWQPAPRAMPNLMRQLREKTGLDVALQTEIVRPERPEVLDYKFLYMHGKQSFQVPADKLSDLRFNLEQGGLLLADACCGSKKFDQSFRAFLAALFPDRKLEVIPLTDDLYSEALNGPGRAIRTVRCRRDTDGRRDLEYRTVEPYLEGIKIDGRWAVIYSKYDLGCALEKTRSPDCLGHDFDSAVRLGTAVVLYALKR